MRINHFIAQATGVGRRVADAYIEGGRVLVNGLPALMGQQIKDGDVVHFDGAELSLPGSHITLMLHKPVGYVCSRNGQGNKTVYELLPPAYHHLKPVGRLDKDSSGLLLMTSDGTLAHQLTHPSFEKNKVYEVILDAELTAQDRQALQQGVQLEDGISRLQLSGKDRHWVVTLHEGRNRQIRRTFSALGYDVMRLHRTKFGAHLLDGLEPGKFKEVSS